jgi:hypothetical protein
MLTRAQKVTASEITREPFTTVSSKADALLAEEEAVLVADIAFWSAGEHPLRDSHVKLRGEVDFDNSRKRAAIFYRFRHLLGFPEILYDVNAPKLEIFELEVGNNF